MLDETTIDLLRRRRRIRVILQAGLGLLAIVCLIDHLGLLTYPGDDLAGYHHQSFTIDRIVDATTIGIVKTTGGAITRVHLKGVESVISPAWLGEHLIGKQVVVYLEPTQPRDSAGNLDAYLFWEDLSSVNQSMIRQGRGVADRATSHTFSAEYIQAESAARRQHLGMWTKQDAP